MSIDKFARTLGYRRIAEETWKTLTADEKKLFKAYADGVNDFVKGVKFSWISSAKLLPPEFYAFDLADKIEPWTPIDSLGILNLIKFSLTWDWPKDFMREILKSESPELAELADELVPYTAEYLHKLVTVLEEEDLRRMGKWSEETLSQKYKKNQDHLKAAEPKRNYAWRAEADAAAAADAQLKKDNMFSHHIDEHAHHSNNWVIHGNHTSTGLPMLANDPHLGTSLPSFWQL